MLQFRDVEGLLPEHQESATFPPPVFLHLGDLVCVPLPQVRLHDPHPGLFHSHPDFTVHDSDADGLDLLHQDKGLSPLQVTVRVFVPAPQELEHEPQLPVFHSQVAVDVQLPESFPFPPQ